MDSGNVMQKIFTRIYEGKEWHSHETVSGPGSTIIETTKLRQFIAYFIKKHNIKTFVDIPCGDLNWMQHIDLTGVIYQGIDIVPALIQKNQERYQRDNLSFRCLDITKDVLPWAVDLMLVRDCLVHFSIADIQLALANIRRARPYFLITTSFITKHQNDDIYTGMWRPINLLIPPFNLKPTGIFTEETKSVYSDKSLIVVEDIGNGK